VFQDGSYETLFINIKKVNGGRPRLTESKTNLTLLAQMINHLNLAAFAANPKMPSFDGNSFTLLFPPRPDLFKC
jgi:hypothetical protein